MPYLHLIIIVLMVYVIIIRVNQITIQSKQEAIWNILQKNIDHMYRVYDIVVQTEINDYDTATDVYQQLRNEFITFYFSNFGGKHTKLIISLFFGNETIFKNYLSSCFDSRYSKTYLLITPKKSI